MLRLGSGRSVSLSSVITFEGKIAFFGDMRKIPVNATDSDSQEIGACLTRALILYPSKEYKGILKQNLKLQIVDSRKI